jgi:hypothetical protein
VIQRLKDYLTRTTTLAAFLVYFAILGYVTSNLPADAMRSIGVHLGRLITAALH